MALLLVGTAHADRNGKDKLETLLQWYKPDVVAVEIDKKRVRQLYKRTEQHIAIDILKLCEENITREHAQQFIATLAYEYLVARAYCKQHKANLVFADPLGSKYFPRIRTPFTIRDLIVKQQNEKDDEWMYSETDAFTKIMMDNELSGENKSHLEKRDTATADILLQPHGRVVHLGGMAHTHGPYHNLYERLKPNVTRIKLTYEEIATLRQTQLLHCA